MGLLQGLGAVVAHLHVAAGDKVALHGQLLAAVLAAGPEGLGAQQLDEGVHGRLQPLAALGPLDPDGDGDVILPLVENKNFFVLPAELSHILLVQGSGRPVGGGGHQKLIGVAGVRGEDGPGVAAPLAVQAAAGVHLQPQALGKPSIGVGNTLVHKLSLFLSPGWG